MRLHAAKDGLLAALGLVGGLVSGLLGGLDTAVMTLVILMGLDYLSGLVVAAVFHRSNKSSSGALESKAGWTGLLRKCFTLALVLMAARLDLLLGAVFIRDAVVIAFCVNEGLSILENAALMGIPIPAALQKAIGVLQNRAEDGKEPK